VTAGYPAVTYLPLVLYVMGAMFLALALMFVLEAKIVRPANRRDALAADRRHSDAPVRRERPAQGRPSIA